MEQDIKDLKKMDLSYEREREISSRKLQIADFMRFFYDNVEEKSVRSIMLEWLENN